MRRRKSFTATVAALTLGSVLGGGAVAQAAPAPPPPAPSETPCAPTARACVDLSTQQTWLQENGRVTYGPVPITSGKPAAPTPTGTFQVQWKDVDHRSSEFDNAPMPYSVFFTLNGIAFHQGSLERPSNGCIHLSTSAAPKYFDSLAPSDEVQVVR
ncbi:lipoprotein-anchoring transpeptidase ErfK/SrfK [Saccharopolyspora lacisalsi]|uniref:Lipoprotein-anchoring transpeptidase ErfK/SrfK n=1 Tax=Halosaccharopolyspora lacisalsi TaxID=1000566 RepID=A0A839DR57_9PSEU|nr:L,D-transpeptidase [Halosaccharopolyspora lacisalsi]MBA8823219.1 lipoprotein-anchoring transpeptidase ErfK/SrfK [Halosaccharopolyspora lacisalsi]